MNLAQGRVLVTGASGFVGRHLLPAIRSAHPEAKVIGTSRRGGDGLQPLEVGDEAAVRTMIRELRPDACVHLAAQSSVDEALADTRSAWRINLHGTLNLAQALLDLHPEGALILASSGDIYGLSFAAGVPLGEEAAPQPANPYAAAKAAADLAVGEMALRGLRTTRLRLFNHTGPGQSPRFVLSNLARQVAAIKAGRQAPIIKLGGLERWRDFLDIEDVVGAYLAVLGSKEPLDGAAYNVASGRPQHLRASYQDLLALAGIEAQHVEIAGMARPYDIAYAAGRPDRFSQRFGWRPQVPWRTTLTRLLDYWADAGDVGPATAAGRGS